MKKFFGLFILLFILCQNVLASELCPTNYELTSGWKKFSSNISGSNFFHKTILEQALEKQLAKNFYGKFNVEIDSFSTPDLKNGKFKSINAIGEDVLIDKLSFSKITISSLCNYNQINKTQNNSYQFTENFPANASIEINNNDLEKITQTTDFKRTLNELNNTLRGFLKIENITFTLNDNKLWYIINYGTPFTPKKYTIKIGTSIHLNGNNITISNSETSAQPTILSILNLTNTLNFINPLDFSTKILENKVVDSRINEVYIQDDKIILNALVIIRK